jgi:O-antigen/teichoic acid export membrane protein
MYSGAQTKTDYRGFTASLTGWLWWLGKGSLAVLDQALFAGANFIVNILLARWLVPADYGAFALAFSVLLLLGSFHTAILTEPMLVFGPGKYRDEFHAYLRLLLYGHFALMSASALFLGVAGELIAVFKSSAVGHTLIGAAIASPLLLLLWLVRRACYVKLHPGWSAMGGCLYLVILVPAMQLVHGKQFFAPAVPLVVMGVAALVVSGFLLVFLRPCWKSVAGGLGFTKVAAEHWHYSRWSLAAFVINCPTNIYFIILPAWLGLSGVGALRAVLNVSAPASQTIAAFSLILLPTLVLERQRAGVEGMNRTMKLYCTLLSIGALAYLGVLWAGRFLVFGFLYSGKYSEYASFPLLMACLLPFANVASTTMGNGLRALERPDCIFWCYVASTIGAVLVGVPLAANFGVGGAVTGILFSGVSASVGMIFLYRKLIHVGGVPEIHRVAELTEQI